MPKTFLIIDVDGFKTINDTMVHASGDAALRITAECLTGTFRQSDILGRFGGGEFLVFLPDIAEVDSARKRADSLVERMNERLAMGAATIKATGSIGVALHPADAITYQDLFDRTDKALYTSKGQGKNCYTLYSRRNLEICD